MSRRCVGLNKSDEQCRRNGVVYLGGGRFVCAQHHIHGHIPSDLANDVMISDSQRERMARVLDVE
jgi:hypothetical protein